MKVVVVGAGVVGLACGYELVQDGHEVVVLDAGRPGAGASHGNAAKIAIAEVTPVPGPGMVVQGLKWMLRSDSPLYVRPTLSPSFLRFMLGMARNCTEARFRRGLELHLELAETANGYLDQWQANGLHFQMHSRGTLLAYENEAHYLSRVRYQEVFDRHGAAADLLDADAVHAHEPALSDRIEYGLYFAGDRQVEPDSLVGALTEHIRKAGGQVLEQSQVVGFERAQGRVSAVRATTGAVPCDQLVLAAGVHTPRLSALLGAPLPIGPGKGYSIDYLPPPVKLRTSLTLEDAYVAVTPLDGMIRIGGTMEFSRFDTAINHERVTAVSRAAAQGLRDWDPNAPHITPWAGLRPMTPDGLPIIGRLEPGGNVLVASGHGMLGLALAAPTGRIVRDSVRTGASDDPRLSPRRFRSWRQW